jgi:hypothetical protein
MGLGLRVRIGSLMAADIEAQVSCVLYKITRLIIGPIKLGRSRGADLGSMGNNRRNMG